jgi:hypothetical protein
MSDGIDRWHVVGTEMFTIPDESRSASTSTGTINEYAFIIGEAISQAVTGPDPTGVVIGRSGAATSVATGDGAISFTIDDGSVAFNSSHVITGASSGATVTSPTTTRGNPAGSDVDDVWTEADYSTGDQLVPAGTSHIQLMTVVQWTSTHATTDDAAILYLKKGGSGVGRTTESSAHYLGFSDRAVGKYLYTTDHPIVECDSGRIFEWSVNDVQATTLATSMYARGYRLG